jgi:hypothetical protein
MTHGMLRMIAALLATCFPAAAEDQQVDAELVLAVDVSRSMDMEEFELQRAGYVSAIRHPDFVRAVSQGVHGRIAIAYFEWAGTPRPESLVAWSVIDGAASADAFATALAARPFNGFRGTSISGAISYAGGLFENNGFTGYRRVIDISGDGPNNIGPPVTAARQKVLDAGVVINGLPILIRPSWSVGDLGSYYEKCVIGGPGAFVLPIRAIDEFATAIRRKLIMEVSGAVSLQPIPIQAVEEVDCMIGETLRRRYSDPYFPELDR